MLAALALLGGTPVAADVDQPNPAQKQAIYAKASVVRVHGFWEITFRVGGKEFKEFVGGMGSGFFISGDGFIATNAHVVEDIKNGEEKAKEKALLSMVSKLEREFGAEIRRMDRSQLAGVFEALKRDVRVVQNNDIVLPDGTTLKYEVKAYGKPVGEGKDVAIIKVDIKDAPNLVLGDSDKMQIQDKVLAIGYPGAADMQGLLDSKSQLEATVTDGAVSAVKRTTDGEPILQVSVPITHGNSGGPAINDKGEVIGLATFGSRGEVQGFNFLVASSTVKKFVKEAKADPSPSPTITLWRKALDELWAGDLDQAIVDFEEVLTLFPTHSEASRMMKQARALKKEGKGKPAASAADGGAGGAGIAVAIILVVCVIGGVVVVMRKQRKQPGHPGVPRQPGQPQPGIQQQVAQPAHGMPHPAPGGLPHPAPHMAHPQHSPPHGMPHPAPGHSPPYGSPMQHGGQGPMMGGRVGPAPISKTVAIAGPSASQPIAATAFGTFAIGSLTCNRGLLNGQRFSLPPQGLLIGRQPGVAQIVVNDSRASGKHVWIGYEGNTLVVVDQGTTNGTFVNDVRHGRISKAPLKDGDIVIVAEPDCLSLTLKLS